jgi:hypothetical protein
MTEFYLNFNHTKLKNEIIELLNQFEYVDKSYKNDISFAKPEHSRQLRKIYNKMNDILDNHYKNIPKELETYNKNTPKEEKPKKIPKTPKIQKTPKPPKNTDKIPIKGGNNIDNSNIGIFQKNNSNIVIDDNDTIMNLTETEKPQNKNNNIISQITELYKKLYSKKYDSKINHDISFMKSYKSQINHFIDYVKNNFEKIDNGDKKMVNQIYTFYKEQIKEIEQKYKI